MHHQIPRYSIELGETLTQGSIKPMGVESLSNALNQCDEYIRCRQARYT